MKINIYPILLTLVAGGTLFFVSQKKCFRTFTWAETVDQKTIEDSWLTYNFFANENSKIITKDTFIKQLKNGSYSNLSIENFLALPIENHRLREYQQAKTAEEAYPLSDRPRQEKDIASVNYFLCPREKISPITVARITDKQGKIRLIKLDGVHRMIAANILRKDLRILWIEL